MSLWPKTLSAWLRFKEARREYKAMGRTLRALRYFKKAQQLDEAVIAELLKCGTAMAWHDGFLAGLGCEPWETASAWAAMVGLDYARGETMPAMPKPVIFATRGSGSERRPAP